MLEYVTTIVVAVLIVGVVFPITSLILGSIYFFSTLAYKITFSSSPEKRLIPNWTRQIAAFALLIMAIVAASVWASKSPMGEELPMMAVEI